MRIQIGKRYRFNHHDTMIPLGALIGHENLIFVVTSDEQEYYRGYFERHKTTGRYYSTFNVSAESLTSLDGNDKYIAMNPRNTPWLR